MCGGTTGRLLVLPGVHGLSPRVRGNRRDECEPDNGEGSIPACAGEPIPTRSWRTAPAVYPRVCGGTSCPSWISTAPMGLSPRVRGNLSVSAWSPVVKGSIPACAGEPRHQWSIPGVSAVYPRVCGGTAWPLPLDTLLRGLSPRVRGNRERRPHAPAQLGSIPACAGEPTRFLYNCAFVRVYPRVCGGTSVKTLPVRNKRGLSPRVRGNPAVVESSKTASRSIPACAGEPCQFATGWWTRWVYPRVCGGTSSRSRARSRITGLSPRVRGNHRRGGGRYQAAGSIPACAGEPKVRNVGSGNQRVYPRVCGGTMEWTLVAVHAVGLSPRVRGNRHPHGLAYLERGSIPACAGESLTCFTQRVLEVVYPRVCGGTWPT